MLIKLLALITIACLLPNDYKSETTNRYREAGKKTYNHFQKALNDEDMKRFLEANYQDVRDFEGMSRITICEKMKWKAEQIGQEYTHWPY